MSTAHLYLPLVKTESHTFLDPSYSIANKLSAFLVAHNNSASSNGIHF